MTDKILPKDLVKKWVNEVMTQSYDITIHPQEYPFGEKFIRNLQKEDWDVAIIEDHKIVVSSNDPLKLASLAIKLKRMGFLIED